MYLIINITDISNNRGNNELKNTYRNNDIVSIPRYSCVYNHKEYKIGILIFWIINDNVNITKIYNYKRKLRKMNKLRNA